MRSALLSYKQKNHVLMFTAILLLTLLLNNFVFEDRYFGSALLLLPATLITGLLLTGVILVCRMVVSVLKKRFPKEEQTSARLFYMIVVFIGISGLLLTTIFNGYELVPQFGYTFNQQGFIWAYFSLLIISIFLTFLMEGLAQYSNWHQNSKDTEKIKKAFTQSQLLGLKSQVNPHFLFNSLNTLSSLIAEDEKEAEAFLNQMSKVYRYMLRGDDEQLVTLETELKFIQSYNYLLFKRFGSRLQINFAINEEDKALWLPPLSLQVLIENAVTQNMMSKTAPLVLSIVSAKNGLQITNNRMPKQVGIAIDFESGLDNLITKYRLLNAAAVVIKEDVMHRSVCLPLLEEGGIV